MVAYLFILTPIFHYQVVDCTEPCYSGRIAIIVQYKSMQS
jgi:hypothetical protein